MSHQLSDRESLRTAICWGLKVRVVEIGRPAIWYPRPMLCYGMRVSVVMVIIILTAAWMSCRLPCLQARRIELPPICYTDANRAESRHPFG